MVRTRRNLNPTGEHLDLNRGPGPAKNGAHDSPQGAGRDQRNLSGSKHIVGNEGDFDVATAQARALMDIAQFMDGV